MSLHLEPPLSSLEQENREAQRAAAEAIEIGRATLSQTVQQGEQLRRAEQVAEDTQYAVDRAGRILRGMTWSGWVANLFTGDVPPPSGGDGNSSSSASAWFHASTAPTAASSNPSPARRPSREPPLTYENVPEPCADAAQAVQNYHANLLIYEQCETPEQRETSLLICDDMHRVAEAKVQALVRTSASHASVASSEIAAFYRVLIEDVQQLRKRQLHRPTLQTSASTADERHQTQPALAVAAHQSFSSSAASIRRPAAGVPPIAAGRTITPTELKQANLQDEHLSVLSQNLEELGNLAGSLSQSILHQNSAMDRLHDKSDSILEQSQRVTRRAERMTSRVSPGWFVPSGLRSGGNSQKATFVSRVRIRYGAPAPAPGPQSALLPLLGRVQGDVYLLASAAAAVAVAAANAAAAGHGSAPATDAHSVAVTFLLYRRGMFVGLKHEATNTWLGQNLLGSLACTATSMGTRDEWQLEEGSLSAWEDDAGGGVADGRDDQGGPSFTSTLLCASAGWGSGGYLYVRPRDQAVLIGGSTVDDKKRAARWTFQPLPPKEHRSSAD